MRVAATVVMAIVIMVIMVIAVVMAVTVNMTVVMVVAMFMTMFMTMSAVNRLYAGRCIHHARPGGQGGGNGMLKGHAAGSEVGRGLLGGHARGYRRVVRLGVGTIGQKGHNIVAVADYGPQQCALGLNADCQNGLALAASAAGANHHQQECGDNQSYNMNSSFHIFSDLKITKNIAFNTHQNPNLFVLLQSEWLLDPTGAFRYRIFIPKLNRSMTLSASKLWRSSKDYLFITFGVAIYALGFSAFILPNQVVIGGVTGIGTIVYFLTGIPVAITQYVLNIILLIIAYKVVGKQFVMGTLFGATMISVWIGMFQPLFPTPLVNGEPFMCVIIGGIMCGFGLGITFVHNGSTGGTDIVAAMVSKKSNVTIGRTMLYVDTMIIMSGYLVHHKIDMIVFGFVVLFLTSYTADMVINTNRQAVQFTIISQKWAQIANAINNQAGRGCTVMDGMGWYSKHPVKILLVMCRKIESVTIFRIIKGIDPDSIVTQANVAGVYGKGFDQIKVKLKDERHQDIHTRIAADAYSDMGGHHSAAMGAADGNETATVSRTAHERPTVDIEGAGPIKSMEQDAPDLKKLTGLPGNKA